MTTKRNAKNSILQSVHETATDLHQLGFIDKRKMQQYDEFLRRKVDVARSSMRADLGQSNDEVEAEFAARRASTLSSATLTANSSPR